MASRWVATTPWAQNNANRLVKDHQSTGWDSNPRSRCTRAESSPLDHQCFFSVGPEGLEPSPAWVRTRDAAANTSVPNCFLSWRGRNRTFGPRLIRSSLSPLSYTPVVGPVGFEPTPTWLKARDAAVTPQPETWLGVCVCIAGQSTSCFSLWFANVKESGSPGNRTQRHPVISRRVSKRRWGQPALDYH